MNCDETRMLLEADKFSAAEESALAEHARTCSDCAIYVMQMVAQDDLLVNALKPHADELRVAKLKQRVAAQIERERKLPTRRPFFVYAAGLAAMVALCVGVYVALRSGKSGSETQVAVKANPETSGDMFSLVAELQTKVRSTQVLDELVQLQVALDAPDDAEGKSTAEDAELYIERILALNGREEPIYRETLQGVNSSGIQERLKKLRDSMNPESPAQVLTSLKLAIATFDDAGRITRAAGQASSAESKYQHGQYKEALDEYRAFHANYPHDWRAEQAQFTAAFILQKKIKDSKQAADAFKLVSEQKTNAPLTRIAKFHLAEAYELAGDIPKAIATLEELRGKTPEHTREREINRRLKYLRRVSKDESGDMQGWGYGLKGKKWRRNGKPTVPAPTF